MSKIEIDTNDILECDLTYGGPTVIKAICRNNFMNNLNNEKSHSPSGVKRGKVLSTKMPERYIINKGATILFWEDGTKTVVKRGKNDEYNKILGFLWAYFQKNSGLSKTKANDYLAKLIDEDELKAMKVIANFGTTLSNVCENIANGFKAMADNMKKKEDK